MILYGTVAVRLIATAISGYFNYFYSPVALPAKTLKKTYMLHTKNKHGYSNGTVNSPHHWSFEILIVFARWRPYARRLIDGSLETTQVYSPPSHGIWIGPDSHILQESPN